MRAAGGADAGGVTDDLLLHRDLAALGVAGALRSEMRTGSLLRIRHGAYGDAEAWRKAKPEERMRARARAFAATCERPPVFAFATAGALWQLPGYRADEEHVHVLDPSPTPARSRGDVIRHSGLLPESDVTTIDGLRVTTLARTVTDLIRTSSPEAAVAYADAALRLVAWRGHGDYDETSAEGFRGDITARLAASPGARGIRQARVIADFADGRAQLPGESVSRLWMQRLGVVAPILQLPVALGSGRHAYPDFAWPSLGRFGEFDGDGKYLDAALTAGREPRAILRAQRAREGELIAATGWRPVRWGSERLTGLAAFAGFLRAQGLLA